MDQKKTASELAELIYAAERAVDLLREGQPDSKAYALVYMLRRKLGYVVRDMGRSSEPYPQDRDWAEEQIDTATWEYSHERI